MLKAICRAANVGNGVLLNNQWCCSLQPKRFLNLQEYASKKLMLEHKLNVQMFRVASSVEEAVEISKEFNVPEYVIKAQILAGGRGKGLFLENNYQGGVKLTKSSVEVPDLVSKMLHKHLRTKQTSKDGVKVNKVMIAEAFDISRETYLAFLMDRAMGGPVMVGSPQGGVDIEEVAQKTPELIYKIPIDIVKGITDEQAKEMAKNLQFTGDKLLMAAEQIIRLYTMFSRIDATQVEINPFGETPSGKVVCFDAKLNFDDNASYRQKKIFALGDNSESDPREVAAEKANLNYIGVDGNIGCLVNGAGLAMATMDIIKLYGGEPANFLDVGGTVTKDQVLEAFKIISSDPKVKVIFINIFGGIVDCVTIANGLSEAAKILDLKVPLVVRLAGNNAEKAMTVLQNSGVKSHTAIELDDAARKAVGSDFDEMWHRQLNSGNLIGNFVNVC